MYPTPHSSVGCVGVGGLQSFESRALVPGIEPEAAATRTSDSAKSAASSMRRKSLPFLGFLGTPPVCPCLGVSTLVEMSQTPTTWARRARDYVGARGPDAADFVQRMVSNDVEALTAGEACDALLLTPKARLIAPLRVLRRADDDFLLLTEPGLGEVVQRQLLRARFAAK